LTRIKVIAKETPIIAGKLYPGIPGGGVGTSD